MNLLKTTLIAGFLISPMAMAQFPKGEYKVDIAHSKVGFEVAHLVISSVEGKFTDFTGELKLDEKIEKSSVKAIAQVSSIDTANAERDKHLRSSDFFDVEKYPQISFESTSVSGTAQQLQVAGILKIKGVSKKVTFTGQFLGKVNDPYGNEKVAFRLTTKVLRKDFGLVYGALTEAGPVIGDEVSIDLNIQAGKPLAKK